MDQWVCRACTCGGGAGQFDGVSHARSVSSGDGFRHRMKNASIIRGVGSVPTVCKREHLAGIAACAGGAKGTEGFYTQKTRKFRKFTKLERARKCHREIPKKKGACAVGRPEGAERSHFEVASTVVFECKRIYM